MPVSFTSAPRGKEKPPPSLSGEGIFLVFHTEDLKTCTSLTTPSIASLTQLRLYGISGTSPHHWQNWCCCGSTHSKPTLPLELKKRNAGTETTLSNSISILIPTQ